MHSYYQVGTPSSYVQAIGWSQSDSYSNVNVSASVGSLDGDSRAVSAYLSTGLGPASDAPVAMANVTVASFASSGAIIPVTLFSGLTLGPGTYYLTLFGDLTATIAWAAASAVTVAPDASLAGQYSAGGLFGSVNPANPWQSTFVSQPIDFFFYDPKGFTVTGILTAAVPEPSTLAPAIIVFAILGVRRSTNFASRKLRKN
jgi:hypothetical protein